VHLLNTFFSNYVEILSIISLSLFVSLSATFIASILGVAFGIPTALRNFILKRYIMRLAETLMAIPPVLMGLVVYLLLSKRGLLGQFELLFTPTAMIIAQTLLVFPIIFALTVSSISKVVWDIESTCISLGAGTIDTLLSILKECRFQLLAIVATGFGRAISEVGAVMMVGGNIKGHTRVMTTYIALETGKGNFNEALLIGLVLLIISFIVNSVLNKFKNDAFHD
jgi:tungstate transport system permease protein